MTNVKNECESQRAGRDSAAESDSSRKTLLERTQGAAATAVRNAANILQEKSAVTFQQLRQAAANGDALAVKVVTTLRNGGQRGSDRSWAEAEKIYHQLSSVDRASVESIASSVDGKTISHIIPRSDRSWVSKRAAGNAGNVLLENAAENIARGNKRMTLIEQVSINLTNKATAIRGAAVNGALIGGAISACGNGYSFYKGEKTVSEAVKDTARDAVCGAAVSGGLTAVTAVCPPLGFGLGLCMTGKSLLWDTGAVHWAVRKTSSLIRGRDGSLELALDDIFEFEEGSVVTIDVDGRITAVLVTAVRVEQPKQVQLTAPLQKSNHDSQAAALLVGMTTVEPTSVPATPA